MKVVIQRVSSASVTIDGEKVADIKKGLLIETYQEKHHLWSSSTDPGNR